MRSSEEMETTASEKGKSELIRKSRRAEYWKPLSGRTKF